MNHPFIKQITSITSLASYRYKLYFAIHNGVTYNPGISSRKYRRITYDAPPYELHKTNINNNPPHELFNVNGMSFAHTCTIGSDLLKNDRGKQEQ